MRSWRQRRACRLHFIINSPVVQRCSFSAMDLTGPASVRQPWWELYWSVCVRQVREYFVEFSFTPYTCAFSSLSLSASRAGRGQAGASHGIEISLVLRYATIKKYQGRQRDKERERKREHEARTLCTARGLGLVVVAVLRPFAGRSQ